MTDAIIIAGGLFEKDFVENYIKDYRTSGRPFILIAADKGLSYTLDLGLTPDFIVGDFDSAGDELLKKAKELEAANRSRLTKLNPIKDDTDTEAALSIAFKEADGDITILSGTGSRLDHVFSNIEILCQGLSRDRNINLIDSHNKIRVIDSNHPIGIEKEKQFGKFVSVFPLSGKVTGLTMQGFFYPLKDADLCGGSSLGQSNEITESVAQISIKTGTLIVIESLD